MAGEELQNNDNEEDVKPAKEVNAAKEVNPYQCEVVVWLVLIGIPLRWIRHIRKEFESADDLVILQRSSVTELKAELGLPFKIAKKISIAAEDLKEALLQAAANVAQSQGINVAQAQQAIAAGMMSINEFV